MESRTRSGPAVCAILLPAQLSAAVGVAKEITLPQTPVVLAEMILEEPSRVFSIVDRYVKELVNVFKAASVAL
jgi:hypothetical protein